MRRLVVLGLLLASCSVDAAETTTTVAAPATTASPASTTSTTEPTTTTVPEVRALGLRSRGTFALVAGATYLHDHVIPFAVTFERDGWLADFVGERWLSFLNEDGDRPLWVAVTFKPFDEPENLLAFVVEHPKSIEVTEVEETVFAGFDAVTVDVLVPPETSEGFDPCWGPSAGPIWHEELGVNGGLYPSVLVGCAWNRVWIVDVDGVSVVVHAGDVGGVPDEQMPLEPVEPLIEEFLDAVSFGEAP